MAEGGASQGAELATLPGASPRRLDRFDFAPVLADATVRLVPLAAAHEDGLARAASNPRTWASHPARERYRDNVFRPYFAFLLAAGGTLAITGAATGEILGCSRYYAAPEMADGLAIGFTFLDCRWWGGTVNGAVKALMLAHAFGTFDEVRFHVAPSNIRSQKAVAKLGAVLVEERVLALSGPPMPSLCYRLTREAWLARRAGAAEH